ncbi:ATP-dependent (S)-NAD(P)H-hydrate dehydratase [Amyelois transitella]|uniref:ATP-dependent (S)-NAD(P)H-hydrate dehydratase n=1 Tax=Amyelois transitella TaxID=680683 RepID=UPI00067C5AD9|nr:ATP-dependent (S)-NAD(P)H-hydrate dehydratase [Amyelois transitella]
MFSSMNISRLLYFLDHNFNNIRKHTMDSTRMIKCVTKCIPPLDGNKHKGQAGRIGVVGGSLEYTGAPYFAGISALKVGADLVHIFCTTPAATVIKSYSPELIVHPLLDRPKALAEISPWLDRLHAIVIGPGLGREPDTFKVVSDLIRTIRNCKIPLVIDADGLFLITENPDLLKDFSSPVVLTPNKIEFERLCNKPNGSSGLTQLGKNILVFRKGATDETFSGNHEIQWKSDIGGSGRRCGGQGDILSGSIATFLHWTLSNHDTIDIINEDKLMAAASLSCYAASRLVRCCNEKSFKTKGRSMLATDMIEHIHEAFEELFQQ